MAQNRSSLTKNEIMLFWAGLTEFRVEESCVFIALENCQQVPVLEQNVQSSRDTFDLLSLSIHMYVVLESYKQVRCWNEDFKYTVLMNLYMPDCKT